MAPKFFPTAEGYVRASEGKSGYAYSYVYNYADHLGNIRLSYAKDPENPNVLKILEENHYYPFGLKHTNYNSDLLVHRADQGSLKIMDPNTPVPLVLVLPYGYKYNGKEFQDELGLGWYDYQARNYDPAIGRWMNIDPLAEQGRRWSPYAYAMDNPVYFIDPDGMKAEASQTASIYYDWDEKRYKTQEGKLATEDEALSQVIDMEPPVNVFTPTSKDIKQKEFNDVFDEANKKGNYKVGDGIFSIYGHGGIGYINNHNSKWNGNYAENSSEFDDMMSSLSPAYKKYAKSKNLAFTLTLYSCNSATDGDENTLSIAKRISKAHPNATIIGFEGFVKFGANSNKTPIITGVGFSTGYDKRGNNTYDNKGYIVTIKNGSIIKRELFTEYLKKQK